MRGEKLGFGPDLTFREATLEDVGDLARLHGLCFEPREHLAALLGESFVRAMYRWFVTSARCLTVCACLKGELVGFSTVCQGPYHRLLFRENLGATARALLGRPWILFLPEVVGRILFSIGRRDEIGALLAREPDAVIHALKAIRADYRGTEVNRRLHAEMVARCRQRGWKKLVAVLYRENTAGRRSAAKNGYREVALSADSGRKVVAILDLEEPANRPDRAAGAGPGLSQESVK